MSLIRETYFTPYRIFQHMKYLHLLFLVALSTISLSQSNQKSSSELYNDLQKLANSATVMYVAAHPDDENTRLISWLTNSKHANTVYLSLTRGDGGQNLIGTEKGDLLGVLRTQELLEARKVDGGNQWFTRALDFGYSKSATETLELWDKEKILGDVVWAIRVHKPDVIITRFDPDSNGRTHGHHTASAMLAMEAFDLAGDKSAYPEQLEFVDTWQPRRLFYNTSWWFYGSRENFEKADKSDMLSVDVGEYFPTLGMSNNEIASLSRSKHACQGFGSSLQRGSQDEWLRLLKGDMPTNGDLLQGIETTWNRYANGMGDDLEQIIAQYEFTEPSGIVDDLITLRATHYGSKDDIPSYQHQAFRELLLDASGVYVEVTSRQPYSQQTDSLVLNYEVTNRSPFTANETTISLPSYTKTIEIGLLAANEEKSGTVTVANPKSSGTVTPYYLQKQHNGFVYNYQPYTQQKDGGKPENAPNLSYEISFNFQELTKELKNIPIRQTKAVMYKTVDPAKGEKYEPFYITPPIAINFTDQVYLFGNNEPQEIEVVVSSFADNVEGEVQIDAGLDWITSGAQPFSIAHARSKQTLTFTVIPPQSQKSSELKASAKIGEQSYFDAFHEVDYAHIQKQFVFLPAKASIGKIEMIVPDVSVAYINGSGDEVAENLHNVGVDIQEVDQSVWMSESLNQFDVAVVGIRAFNTLDNAAQLKTSLQKFAEDGGTVIVQYQTSRGLKIDDFAPHKLRVGRDRISQEDATLRFVNPKHALVNTPNKITQIDLDNWVQERGLYFASEWGEEYEPIFAGNDTGEDEKQGMLLVADVGEGKFVYTGLSFFRELPAGVPGAYRIMMNLLALGEE